MSDCRHPKNLAKPYMENGSQVHSPTGMHYRCVCGSCGDHVWNYELGNAQGNPPDTAPDSTLCPHQANLAKLYMDNGGYVYGRSITGMYRLHVCGVCGERVWGYELFPPKFDVRGDVAHARWLSDFILNRFNGQWSPEKRAAVAMAARLAVEEFDCAKDQAKTPLGRPPHHEDGNAELRKYVEEKLLLRWSPSKSVAVAAAAELAADEFDRRERGGIPRIFSQIMENLREEWLKQWKAEADKFDLEVLKAFDELGRGAK